ncbi:fimbrial protein [Novilysobacter defluvii]|nr:type 1 fimbrial protein [Lysobacter defluvii]
MRRIALMACLPVLLGAPTAALADGVIRFSGRIVEAPCAIRVPADGQFALTGCPLSAEGSTLTIERSGPGAGARLVDVASGAAAERLPVAAAEVAVDRRNFSSHYRIEPATPGSTDAYLVSLDYL